MSSTVSLVAAADYEPALLDRAVSEAVELAGGLEVRGATVLLKPNLLNASAPERAATTHPGMVRAALRWLKRAGAARILVGDSPGWQGLDAVGQKTGVREAAEGEGAVWTSFAEAVEVENPRGALVKRFRLAKAFAEADLLVTLPKLKTHGLMYYTGALKNLFGLIPGFEKGAFHLRFPGRPEFAAMLADLALACDPDFALMDAVVAMEGPGPNSGRPARLGLVMASRDSLALDWSAARLIGYDPAAIPYLASLAARPAAERGRFCAAPEGVEEVGLDPASVRPAAFELVPILRHTDFLAERLPPWLHRLVKDCMVAKPRFDHRTCVRCAGCVKICPAKALEFRPGPDGRPRVEIDYAKCIRCYCCHEVCPEDAIELVKRPW